MGNDKHHRNHFWNLVVLFKHLSILSKRGGSVRRFTYFITIVLVLSSLYCGADLLEEGKKAYLNGDYTQAINLLTKAKEGKPH